MQLLHARHSDRGPRRGVLSATAAKHLSRIGVWCLAAVVVLALFYGFGRWTHRLFFSANPHFTLQHVDIQFRGAAWVDKKRVIDELKLEKGSQNLYAIDLAEVRRTIFQNKRVADVRVWRERPDTLKVEITPRSPIAQLLRRSGKLVDKDGIVIPPSKRPNEWTLPVITPIPNMSTYQNGDRIDDPMLQSALELLQILASTKKENYHWLDVDLIHLDRVEHTLRVRLHERKQYYIKKGAIVIFPTLNLDVEVKEALLILERRIADKEETQEIDTTFRRPVVTED